MLGVACRGSSPEKPADNAAEAKGEAPATAPEPGQKKGRLLILGFDGVDPDWLDDYIEKGSLPTLAKLTAAHGGKAYRRLASTNPPQSPVAWTSFATGTSPGDHGIYDFIGRTLNPGSPLPVIPRVATTSFEVQVEGPPAARNLRNGQPFWQLLGNDGVRVAALNVPYSFPPDPMRQGRMLSGLGVPDLRETNSTFTYAASDVTDTQVARPPGGGVMVKLSMKDGHGEFTLEGPTIAAGKSGRMGVVVKIAPAASAQSMKVEIAGKSLELPVGRMSDWVELEFTHGGAKIAGIARLLPLSVGAQTRLFISPVSMHPRAPYSPVSFPNAFAAEIADELGGLYKTVGWDHDTSALNAEVIDEAAFLADMESIESQRRAMLMTRLDKDDWDLLIWVSTATDRVAHMFYRLIDPDHPRHDAALAERHGDAIEAEYRRMDATVAQALEKLRPDDTLLILSDHGFHGYRRGLHVNQWLRSEGLLALQDGAESSDKDFFLGVDWARTKAYALGTGQVYLNRRGREPLGVVEQAEASALLDQIERGLLALRDRERGDAPVVRAVYRGSQVFKGARAAQAPDLQLAFAEHYRTSWETILGGVPAGLFADNPRKWSGDHAASDVAETEGILVSNRPLTAEQAAIVDLAPTALAFFSKKPPARYEGKALLSGGDAK